MHPRACKSLLHTTILPLCPTQRHPCTGKACKRTPTMARLNRAPVAVARAWRRPSHRGQSIARARGSPKHLALMSAPCDRNTGYVGRARPVCPPGLPSLHNKQRANCRPWRADGNPPSCPRTMQRLRPSATPPGMPTHHIGAPPAAHRRPSHRPPLRQCSMVSIKAQVARKHPHIHWPC